MSIRSPITHIPKHTALMPSPPGAGSTSASYRPLAAPGPEVVPPTSEHQEHQKQHQEQQQSHSVEALRQLRAGTSAAERGDRGAMGDVDGEVESDGIQPSQATYTAPSDTSNNTSSSIVNGSPSTSTSTIRIFMSESHC